MKKDNTRSYKIIITVAAVILGIYFFIKGLIAAQYFLAPLFIAGVLSLVFYPLAKKLERLNLRRAWASLISVVILFFISLGIVALFFFQVQSFINEWPDIKKT